MHNPWHHNGLASTAQPVMGGNTQGRSVGRSRHYSIGRAGKSMRKRAPYAWLNTNGGVAWAGVGTGCNVVAGRELGRFFRAQLAALGVGEVSFDCRRYSYPQGNPFPRTQPQGVPDPIASALLLGSLPHIFHSKTPAPYFWGAICTVVRIA